ncbi:MAG: FitA-like ribbon-helix-helix domain-containing protein [Phycisphaerales bacterium]
MGEVRIRNLEEEVVQALKAQAQRHGISFESELRQLLTDAAWRPRRQMVKELRKLQAKIRAEVGILSDSAPIIRAQRDGLE